MRANKESVLLQSSSNADVQNSGGKVTITGLNPVSKKNITSVKQVKYKAEVAQVYTIGAAAVAPVADTVYSVAVWDPNRKVGGYNESIKKYSYTTPTTLTDIGGTAALQREYINGQIVSKINADPSNHAVAASLLLGTGFTITDDGGYYPIKSQSMTNVLGANKVDIISGYGVDITLTTAAVYSSGVGAILASMSPVVDANTGGLISGSIDDAPLTTAGAAAIAGQKYDAFVITSLTEVVAFNVTGQIAYSPKTQTAWVDNGTGAATTNLAGFLTFERAWRKAFVGSTYSADSNAWVDFLDSPMLFQGAAGAVPATTGESKISTAYGQWVYNNVGTNTITVPTPGNSGLLLDQDLTATEGAEHTPSLLTNNSQSFIVGKDECSITVKTTAADHTDANLYIGFRKKAAHAADFNNYTDLAAIGYLGDLLYTWGILNNAATVATNTTVVPTDAAVEEFIVKVDINGVVSAFYQGVKYPVYSVGTTPMVFDATDEIIPFVLTTNIGGGDPDVTVSQILSVADINWIG